MIKGDITYQDKLNELRLALLHPSSSNKTYVLVEGDSDIRLYRKLFDLAQSKVESIPGGNDKLEECVATLSPKYPLIIGIRDADFIHIQKPDYAKTNIFLTDFHDLELSLISEHSILNAILFEFTEVPTEKHNECKDLIFDTFSDLSHLKFLNAEEDLKLNFSCGFQDLLSFSNKSFDLETYHERAKKKSPDYKDADFAKLQEQVSDLKSKHFDSYQISNGHDFLKTLSAYLSQENNGKNFSHEYLASIIRMNYTKDHFKKSNLFASIRNWAEIKKTEFHL